MVIAVVRQVVQSAEVGPLRAFSTGEPHVAQMCVATL
jgi:hypothetical protein